MHTIWAAILSFHPMSALEDDTDQLLELMAKSDELATPPHRRRHYRPQPSLSPPPCHHALSSIPPLHQRHHSRIIQSSHSYPKSSRKHSPKHCTRSQELENREMNFSEESGENSDGRVMGNFTPAPLFRCSEEGHTSTSSHLALKQLLALLQEYVIVCLEILFIVVY